jgi:hypothetical protein
MVAEIVGDHSFPLSERLKMFEDMYLFPICFIWRIIKVSHNFIYGFACELIHPFATHVIYLNFHLIVCMW